MNITNYFNFDQGGAVISPQGMQKYTEKLNSYSQIYPLIYSSVSNNKFAIDSCWESGNIYYANYSAGYVKKIQFDGTEIASLSITNPLALSVIQYDTKMSTVITDPPQEDKGCWIISGGNIVKTDNELNILYTYSSLASPYAIVSCIDEGCIVYDSYTKTIYKFDSMAQLMYEHSSFPSNMVFRDMCVSSEGYLWMIIENEPAVSRLYYIYPSSASFSVNYKVISPPTIPGNTSHIGSVDVDRNSEDQDVYVAGGNDTGAWINKYDFNGDLVTSNSYTNVIYPYVIKVVQGYGARSLYLLSDMAKWDDFGYGSSSSSSSSSSIDSSSSSSSSL